MQDRGVGGFMTRAGMCGLYGVTVFMIAGLLWQTERAAAVESLEDKASLWGQMHGAAIYCRVDSAHDFGVKAVAYFRRRASGAQLENLKQIYGTKMIETAHSSPSGKIGRGCGSFRRNYEKIYTMLRG